jgi:hypothetical protein
MEVPKRLKKTVRVASRRLINLSGVSLVIAVSLVYFAVTAYYMWPSVVSCHDTTYGFGDNTAGPIWRGQLPENQGFAGGFTHETNYPMGDKLYNPAGYSYFIQTGLIKGSMAIAGDVCGYNAVNMLGYILSALAMFGFIYALTRRKLLAILAGFAVSYAPYYQMKVGGHPSYGFQAIFIGLLWLFYRLIKYQRRRDAVLLGLLVTASIYFDPYFSLFSALILCSLFVAWLATHYREITSKILRSKYQLPKTTMTQLKLIILSATVMLAGAIPLAALYVSQKSTIENSVAAARGNVLAEAKACSNYPHEYFVPFVLHPLFSRIVGKADYVQDVNALKNNFPCGIGEDSIGLSLTLTTVVGVGGIIFAWEKLNKRRLRLESILSFSPKLLLLSIVLLGLVAIGLGLPPTKYQGFLPTPSYLLLHITETWRTLARVYMLVNISLVVLSSIILAYFLRLLRGKKMLQLLLVAIVALGIFIEYQAFPPLHGNTLSSFSYSKNAPQVYTWLKGQKDISVIAEYPIERQGGESDAVSYYLTMQTIHQKKLFNSVVSDSPEEKYKYALKDITDPQTIPILRAFGVDTVIVHGVPLVELKDVDAKVIFQAPQPQFNLLSHTPTVKNDNSVVLDISKIKPATHMVLLAKDFYRNTNLIASSADWGYEATNGAKISIAEIINKQPIPNTIPYRVCFSARMSIPTEETKLLISIDGSKPVISGSINGVWKRYSISAVSNLNLFSENKHNFQVSNIGCSSNEQ